LPHFVAGNEFPLKRNHCEWSECNSPSAASKGTVVLVLNYLSNSFVPLRHAEENQVLLLQQECLGRNNHKLSLGRKW
jgi:hypothetical protein